MRSDTWVEDRKAMRACAEHEAHLQRSLKPDQHPEKRIVQVDPRSLLDLLDSEDHLRAELAEALGLLQEAAHSVPSLCCPRCGMLRDRIDALLARHAETDPGAETEGV